MAPTFRSFLQPLLLRPSLNCGRNFIYNVALGYVFLFSWSFSHVYGDRFLVWTGINDHDNQKFYPRSIPLFATHFKKPKPDDCYAEYSCPMEIGY